MTSAPTLPSSERHALDTPWELRELGSDWNDQWDALAGSALESGFMQSSAWAAFKRAEGYRTWRFGLFRNGELGGGGTFHFYPSAAGDGLIVCPEGPVLPWHDRELARDGLRRLIVAARSLPEARGAIGLRIEPNLEPPAPSLLRNWTRGPVDLTPVHTLVADLARTDEELLAAMRPKGRYNLALSRRHGVTVRRSADMRDLSAFYALFAETADRNEFFAEPYGFFLNLGQALFPSGDAELFLADHDAETLGAILVVAFGHRATYLYGGSSEQRRNVMPNYLLHWTAMQAAREKGCREYDFYGYDPFGSPDHLYAGISQFKSQFGGARRDTIGARDLIFYDRLADRMAARLTDDTQRGRIA